MHATELCELSIPTARQRLWTATWVGRRRSFQAAALEERLQGGVPPAEGAERLERVPAVAAGEQFGAEAVAVGPAEPAVLGEPVHGLGVQHLAPDVGVVARSVAVARKDVLE